MHLELSTEHIEKYVRDPEHCPFCDSNELLAGELIPEGFSVWREIECEDCHAEWTEVFTLSTIEDAKLLDEKQIIKQTEDKNEQSTSYIEELNLGDISHD